MNEEEELDPIEKELREAQEQYDAENQEVYDEVTKGNEEIRRKNTEDDDEQLNLPLESRNLARVGAGLAFEVGANSLLDALTLVPGSQAVGSAVINSIAQGIRGGKFSFGEVLGSAAASQIPGLAQGKAITKAGRITRAAGTGAVSGAIESTSITAVDEGRLPTAQEFGLGVGAGSIFGAGFAQAADLVDPKVTGIFRDLRARVQQGRQSSFELAGSVGAAKINPKGSADQTGKGSERFLYGEDVLGNLPPKTIELLNKNGFTDNESILLVSNFNKPIPRDLSATIASLFNTVDDFNSFKQTMLPVYLESMSKIRRTKTPQADHIAQLRAALPFFYGKPVELWPQISDIIVKEGVFGLGHNNKNLVFLEFPVHTVKTAFWKEQVGDAGEKFFAGRTLDTPEQIRAAAKEFATFIRKSNKVVNDAVEQYNFMNQKQIDQDELVEFIDRLGANPLEAKYSIKQVKDILKQMEEDGFKATSKASEAAETKIIKSEQKTAKDKKARQAKIDQEFQKSVVESETYRKYYASDQGKFKSPLVKGSKDDMLITHAEDIYEEMSVDKNPETRNAMIKKIMKIIKPRYKG